MPSRMLLAVLLIWSAAGCATARPELAVSDTEARPDPERWDRAACLRGAYPYELDDRAYARARQADLQARLNGAAAPFATQMLLEARATFEARCTSWITLARRQSPAAADKSPGFVTVGLDVTR